MLNKRKPCESPSKPFSNNDEIQYAATAHAYRATGSRATGPDDRQITAVHDFSSSDVRKPTDEMRAIRKCVTAVDDPIPAPSHDYGWTDRIALLLNVSC